MALPQERYIKITSGEGTVTTAERSLQTLVISDAELSANDDYPNYDASSTYKKGYGATYGGAWYSCNTDGTTGTWDSSKWKLVKDFDESTLLKFSNALDVGEAFGVSSKEYAWAVKYFSYVSPSGETPSRLTFAKHGDAEGTTDAFLADFNRVAAMTNDFACFTFLTETPPTEAQVKAVAAANAALNYRFLFVASLTNATVDDNGSVADAMKALVGEKGTNGTEVTYQREIANTGASLKVPKTYIVAAILSAIDWDSEDGSVNPMFRQVTGETADVISAKAVTGADASQGADDLDDANVDYYASVQTNGTEQAFFQRGFNSDGESVLVYVGELWLKSRISTRLMTLFLSSNKIPANVDGNARIFAEIDTVCNEAVRNGVIEVGKTLSQAARTNILSWTRDSAAADKVEDAGYWLQCQVKENDDGKGYVAKYLLIYSKGDAIIKVEGNDIFV